MMRHKAYVTVNADHLPDGTCRPRSVEYDGATYPVERIRDVRPAASLRVGGTGVRYTVRVGGQETYLFDEENGKWFVEAK